MARLRLRKVEIDQDPREIGIYPYKPIYKDGKYIDLEEFKPDIVFYEQPWGLPRRYKPYYVSKFALTFYLPYGFSMLDYIGDYNRNFHCHLQM